ncbi:MAG: hypothetical protein AAFY02_07410 [Pseudomonadota bacterium]
MSHSDPVAVASIDSSARLVVLARSIRVTESAGESALLDGAAEAAGECETCLGAAVYRHRRSYDGAAEPPGWTHVEFRYFRDLLPATAVEALVSEPMVPALRLLRAEVLLTSPESFHLPGDWRGSAQRPELQASLEYIQVKQVQLARYREVMRDYCGPAARNLVRARRVGTFRAMETAAVLYQDPDFHADWNQIHLCELNPDTFEGFGPAFTSALRDDPLRSATIAESFAGLPAIRSLPYWTLNAPLVEDDSALLGLAG